MGPSAAAPGERRYRPIVAAIVALLIAGAGPALAGNWFLHEFGELRSYHGDWLSVCAEKGEGECRAVHYERKANGDTFFGSSRLSLLRLGDERWVIEFYDEGLVADDLHDLSFVFGGETVAIPRSAWKIGTPDYDNSADTVTIMDPAVAATLVQKMRAGSRLTIRYAPSKSDGAVRIALRGVTAATDAIEKHIRQRH